MKSLDLPRHTRSAVEIARSALEIGIVVSEEDVVLLLLNEYEASGSLISPRKVLPLSRILLGITSVYPLPYPPLHIAKKDTNIQNVNNKIKVMFCFYILFYFLSTHFFHWFFIENRHFFNTMHLDPFPLTLNSVFPRLTSCKRILLSISYNL